MCVIDATIDATSVGVPEESEPSSICSGLRLAFVGGESPESSAAWARVTGGGSLMAAVDSSVRLADEQRTNTTHRMHKRDMKFTRLTGHIVLVWWITRFENENVYVQIRN